MHKRYASYSLIAAIGLFAVSARADLITNGSFESGTGTDSDNWTSVLAGALTTAEYPTATGTSPYGPRFLALNFGTALPGGSATQDFGTTDVNTTYDVSFAYAQLGGAANDQTLTVTINNTSAPNVISTHLYTDTAPGTDFSTVWKRATFQFTGIGLPTGITFADTGVLAALAQNSDLLVDDVSVNAAPAPEPTTIAALTAGCVGLVRRRRNR